MLAATAASILIADYYLFSQRAFDGDRWRSGDVRQRARMRVDLQRSQVLLGKDRKAVFALLGPPDYDDYAERRKWVYYFVNGSLVGDAIDLPFSGWTQWLEIDFNEAEGRVHSVTEND